MFSVIPKPFSEHWLKHVARLPTPSQHLLRRRGDRNRHKASPINSLPFGKPIKLTVSPIMPCGLCRFSRAYNAFRILTKETVTEQISNLPQQTCRQLDEIKVHRFVYACMHEAERHFAKQIVAMRLASRGLLWVPIENNLKMMPSQVPGEHRFALMRRLLNGGLTSHRLHPIVRCVILNCPFCGAATADSVIHRSSCVTLSLVRAHVYATPDFEVTQASAWLQTEISGAAQLQQTLAYLSAVIRLRRVIVDGRSFFDLADMTAHFRRLLIDPWATGSPHNMSTSERRALRARPPSSWLTL